MCTGSAPTFSSPPSVGHDGSSCANDPHLFINAACGDTGYTLKIYRVQNAVATLISTQSIPDGPLSGFDMNTSDTPPCSNGTVGYYAEILCSGVVQSTSATSNVSQGGNPTVDTFTLVTNNCVNTASVRVRVPCGDCAGTLKLYRSTAAVTFAPGEVIYSVATAAGPSDQTFNYDDTPPCGNATYHYAWKLEMAFGSFAVSELTASQAGSATLSDHRISSDADCNITNTVRISKLCGICTGTIKLYRKLNGPPSGVPAELQYSAAVAAGPINNVLYTYTDKPGAGNWYYQWSVLNVDGGVDDTLPPKSIVTVCNIYVPAVVALPTGEMEKQVVLVQVTGSKAGGLVFTDKKILNLSEQRLEWWYHKNGGCAAFRLLTHEFLEDDTFTDAMDEAWELHVRIKLGGESAYTTWYRGVLRSIKQQEQGTDLYMDVRGYGYIEMLNNIMVQRQYPAGLTVKQIVDDIMANDVVPWTRVVRPMDLDVTNGDSGVDASNYVIKDPLHFECSALVAIKFLAELQGSREYGVDAQRRFYFRANSSTIGANFYLLKDVVDRVAGGKILGQTNSYKIAGKSFGARDMLKIREDVTDATQYGRRERPVEIPWVTGDQDASAWADNIINISKSGQDWSVITKKTVTSRLDASHPLPKTKVYGSDMSNDVKTYDIAKIQYIEGGSRAPLEVREKGVPKKTPDGDQPLKVQYYLGRYPNDLIDELRDTMRDQIEALKGRHKQFRYPVDITNGGINTRGIIPGEMKHYHILPDVTNIDIINSSLDLSDPTNPRGVLAAWVAGQWAKVSLRRTFLSFAGVRGLYIGEVATLITDVTSHQSGIPYYWTGATWSLIGSSGPATTEGAHVTSTTEQTMNSSGANLQYTTVKSNDNGVANLSGDNTILTAQTSGPVAIEGRAIWKAGAAGTYHKLELINVDTGFVIDTDNRNDFVSNSSLRTSQVGAVVYLLSGQRVRLKAYTDSDDSGAIINFASLAMYFLAGGGSASSAIGSPSGPAAGDLSGAYPSPTVSGLQDATLPVSVVDGILKRNHANTGWEQVPYSRVRTALQAGGEAPAKLDAWDTPDDTVLLDVTQSRHGLFPKLTGDADKIFWEDGRIDFPYNSLETYYDIQPLIGQLWASLGLSGAPDTTGTLLDHVDSNRKFWCTASTDTTPGHSAGVATQAGVSAVPYGALRRFYAHMKGGPNSSDNTSVRVWVALPTNSGGGLSAFDDPMTNTIGFRFSTNAGDTHWMCASIQDGVAGTFVDSGVAYTPNGEYHFYIDASTSGSLKYYINGNLVVTISTNIPTTGGCKLYQSVTTLNAVSKSIRMGRMGARWY